MSKEKKPVAAKQPAAPKTQSVAIYTEDQKEITALASKNKSTVAEEFLKLKARPKIDKADLKALTTGAEKSGVSVGEMIHNLILGTIKASEFLKPEYEPVMENIDTVLRFIEAAKINGCTVEEYLNKLTDGFEPENLIIVAKSKETIAAVTAAAAEMKEAGMSLNDDEFLTEVSSYYIEA